MNNTLSVARIVTSTSTDGPGLRTSLYLQGCQIRCLGCHNSGLWDIEKGQEISIEEVAEQILESDENISILGGEPMMQYERVVELCKLLRRKSTKTIWLWSGYTFDYIEKNFTTILGYIDVLVDGPYIHELAQKGLRFRGSSNQRILPITPRGKIEYKQI